MECERRGSLVNGIDKPLNYAALSQSHNDGQAYETCHGKV
jgi:hypothetical protein